MKRMIIVPKGSFCSDDAAAQKRRELAERLKRGEAVNITPTGQVVVPGDPMADAGRTLRAPEGKLA